VRPSFSPEFEVRFTPGGFLHSCVNFELDRTPCDPVLRHFLFFRFPQSAPKDFSHDSIFFPGVTSCKESVDRGLSKVMGPCTGDTLLMVRPRWFFLLPSPVPLRLSRPFTRRPFNPSFSLCILILLCFRARRTPFDLRVLFEDDPAYSDRAKRPRPFPSVRVPIYYDRPPSPSSPRHLYAPGPLH